MNYQDWARAEARRSYTRMRRTQNLNNMLRQRQRGTLNLRGGRGQATSGGRQR